ncbi:MAG: hypothetical protein ACOC5T_01860, partial [Elusimicrobiota bacterium]
TDITNKKLSIITLFLAFTAIALLLLVNYFPDMYDSEEFLFRTILFVVGVVFLIFVGNDKFIRKTSREAWANFQDKFRVTSKFFELFFRIALYVVSAISAFIIIALIVMNLNYSNKAKYYDVPEGTPQRPVPTRPEPKH